MLLYVLEGKLDFRTIKQEMKHILVFLFLVKFTTIQNNDRNK